ncbi:hypothetical protein HLB35_07315 [Halomonas sp. TBZ9]|uniref:Uncharacterized protein n=1 Tax=Vreelandella azerica TaxID=2732867 RepID=A0A7Y3TWW4_9GAMM|nr:hypothetical protein [Halomonas azerica]NOG31625.1 hypothetical protein [Halomonas azerica]
MNLDNALNIDEFLSHAFDGNRYKDWKNVTVSINCECADIPVKVIKKPENKELCDKLVFFFHGAIDRKKRSLPVFEGNFLKNIDIEGALVISIADPTLNISDELGVTWYAGIKDLDLPVFLDYLFKKIIDEINPSKVLFSGGSIGGYPALAHAAKIKNSIVVLRNPILNIKNYFSGHIERYAKYGWSASNLNDIENYVVWDAADCYMKYKDNNVKIIYIQNPSDHHFWMQAVGFLQKINDLNKKDKEYILFISSHHTGYVGHRFPPNEWGRWVKAACEDDTNSVLGIADKYELLRKEDEKDRAYELKVVASEAGFEADEIAIQSKISNL